MLHVAIIQPNYADLILSGQKTMESRLSRARVAPFGVVECGEHVYFKVRGGGYCCRATAYQVLEGADLTPEHVDALRERYEDRVLGGDEYWSNKSSSKYATLIGINNVEAIDSGPDLSEIRKALPRAGWLVLPEEAALPTEPQSKSGAA